MRLWRSAVVALALSSSIVAVAEASAAPRVRENRCGALRGTAVYGIRSQGMRCPEARRVARQHERQARRRGRGHCSFERGVCRVLEFWCSGRVGMNPRPKDGLVICGAGRNTKQVTFHYDHRRFRLPPPPRYDLPQEEPPPLVTVRS